ncbi:MAG: arginine deiminase family protein [bacterium]|nr:arginine deiminase family protein [bacterium]
MKRLVMCLPNRFDITYHLSTNRWMQPHIRPNKELANKQWFTLFTSLLQRASVFVAQPKDGLPDMVFAANAGLLYRNMVILSNFFHEERRRETAAYAKFFREYCDRENVWALPNGAFFEGQGDAIWLDDNRILIGHGVRTNLSGVNKVGNILRKYNPSIEIIPLPMKPPEQIPANEPLFYHLDTCLLHLPKAKSFMIYKNAFLPEAIDTLHKLGNIAPVELEEASQFVCNSFVVDDETIFVPWINDRLKIILNRLGYTNIKVFDMCEFIKAGGSVKCLILDHQQ